MKIVDCKQIYSSKHPCVYFLRVNPEDITETLNDIFNAMSNLAWINKFDQDFTKNSFSERAKTTLQDIKEKIESCENDQVTSSAAEYIVSELAREAIISELSYLDIPLAELYSKKKSGNPGFDFHTQTNDDIIIFGEAKYINGKNAYGSGLKQAVKFIEQKKDIKDIADLRDFCTSKALSNASNNLKGFAIAFSSKKTSTEKLIKNIECNAEFIKLLAHKEIIMVAVNI